MSNTSFPLSAADAVPLRIQDNSTRFVFGGCRSESRATQDLRMECSRREGLRKNRSHHVVGGRKLMLQDGYNAPNPNFSGEFDFMRNGASSSYQALQAQFRHLLAHGVQALLSYTWAHSIDDVSSDAYYLNVPPGASSFSNRGSSDYDIRQRFPQRFPIIFPLRAKESGRRFLETGPWTRSFTPEQRRR